MTASLLVLLWLQPPTAVTTCRSVGLDPQRTWQFDRADDVWRVTHWTGATRTREARVSLPASAAVQLTTAVVSVKARTSNGGIDVSLAGTPARAQLDIYVSYELEVNVDTSLTPAIDDLNTDGPIGVTCDVAAPR
ncbi:hypothetical protein [Luteitalea sp.]|uniref:hypothetical protein n=1 Tax=Luteitalea sp. TaxID=2004800 RepID=UPI0025BE95A0|nr:hypothetical protein [Luteitalea sp.]